MFKLTMDKNIFYSKYYIPWEGENHILSSDIFDYHPLRECNIYFIKLNIILSLFQPFFPGQIS